MGSQKRAHVKARGPGRPVSGDSVPSDEEVLQRGLEAFASRGFDGTSVRDLARLLGVSHNFIHDRYGSKEGFWRAVVDHSLRGAEEGVDALLRAPAPSELERLRGIMRHVAAYPGQRNLLNQVLAFEGGQATPRLMYIFERYLQPFTVKLTPVISQLVRDGVLRPVPWHVLFFLVAAPGNARGNRVLADLLGRPRGEEDVTADLFADLIINALRVHPEGDRAQR